MRDSRDRAAAMRGTERGMRTMQSVQNRGARGEESATALGSDRMTTLSSSLAVALSLVLFAGTGPARAGAISFHDVAAEAGSGIDYQRQASPRKAVLDAIKARGMFRLPEDIARTPLKPHGAPGVAVFDYDGDGDLDIYVTNGPGAASALYANQYGEQGRLTFVDMAGVAGVGLMEDDNTGVCYGDIDNDGDEDLMVLTLGGANHLFENRGDGTFLDIGAMAGVGGGDRYSTSCSMGDIDNDGLLDIVVGNTYTDWNDNLPIVSFEAAGRNEHNQLYRNLGGNRFEDVSDRAGIRSFAGISWAVGMVDYDLDGDMDIVVADDQGAKPSAKRGGKDLGYIRIYANDGTGRFTDVTAQTGTDRAGAWMGLAFGDFDHNGRMDIFASNVGDYFARMMNPIAGFVSQPGDWLSGWFLAGEDGRFEFPGVGELEATPFGWGNAAFDYDNDGDTDIVYHGGIDMGAFVEATNAGTVLENDGTGRFGRDGLAFAATTNHARRAVNGVAVGDLNQDGFVDIVSVSTQNWPMPLPLVPALPPGAGFGGPFDDAVFAWPTFMPVDPADLLQGMVWTGLEPANGTLSIDISSGNGNGWVKVKAVGGAGLSRRASVNRDGIGAVLEFTPKKGKTAMQPVTGGSSYSSQHGLEKVFGLGRSSTGTLEVLWPGGVRNRLYRVHAGERIDFPEIPCSYDDDGLPWRHYRACVSKALHDYQHAGVIGPRLRKRLFASAMKAFAGKRHGHHDEEGRKRRHHARTESESD